MLSRKKYPARLRVLLLGLLCLLAWSCTSRDKYAGSYKTEEKGRPEQVETFLDLKEGGEGAWIRGDEEIPFSWYIKGGELRINTKAGGVIVGKIQGDRIEISLPAGKTISFKKTG